jgi:hypothetical protein
MMPEYIAILNARPDALSLLIESIRNWWTKKICAVKENYFLIN